MVVNSEKTAKAAHKIAENVQTPAVMDSVQPMKPVRAVLLTAHALPFVGMAIVSWGRTVRVVKLTAGSAHQFAAKTVVNKERTVKAAQLIAVIAHRFAA